MADAAAGPATASRPRWLAPILAAILAFSAWLQVTVVLETQVSAPLRADASEYFAYASNLSELGIYSRAPRWRKPEAVAVPDKERPPGYPLFLRLAAGVPEPTEPWALRVALIQAGLGVLTVALLYLCAATFLRPSLALLATLLCAVNPWLATSNVYILSESLFTFLLFAATWLTLRALGPGAGAKQAALAGLAWGLCSLVRSTSEFLPPMLFVLTLALPGWRTWRRIAGVGLLAFLLAMSPWLLRNLTVPTAPGDSDLMVTSIVHGSYPGFRYQGREETFGYPYRHDPEFKAAVRDLPSALAFAGRRFAEQPLRQSAWYLFGKPYFFLSLEDVQSYGIEVFPLTRSPYYERFFFAMLREGTSALHAPLVLSGLLAMFALAFAPAWLRLSVDARRAGLLVALVIFYAIVLHMAAAPFPRYAVPFRPLLYALALLPLQAAWLAWRARRRDLVA